MKILFLIPRMNNGGAERVIAYFANEFSKNNSVKILTLVGNKSFYELNSNVKFESLNCVINRKNKITRNYSMVKNFIEALRFISKKVNEFKPDVVISFLFETNLIVYLLKVFGKLKSIKWISSERCDPKKGNLLVRKLTNIIFMKTDLLVCQSKAVLNYYNRIKNKIVISNPIDISLIPKPITEGNTLKICAVGRLMAQKNFSLLINAFYLLKQEANENVTLTIYGEGVLRNRLENQICSLNLEKSVFLPGKSNDVLNEIKDSTIFVMSSDYEGFPNALLEAMAVGLPVISTDFPTGTARELIHKENGIIVACGDKIALKNAMLELLNDKAKREKMRKNNLYVRDKYSVEKICRQWEEAIGVLANFKE